MTYGYEQAKERMLRHETGIWVDGSTFSRREIPSIVEGSCVQIENIGNRFYAKIRRVTRVGRDLRALLVEVTPMFADEFTIRNIEGKIIETTNGLTVKVTDAGLPYGIDSDLAYSIEVWS